MASQTKYRRCTCVFFECQIHIFLSDERTKREEKKNQCPGICGSKFYGSYETIRNGCLVKVHFYYTKQM